MVAGELLGDRLAVEEGDGRKDAWHTGLAEDVVDADEAVGLRLGGVAYVLGVLGGEHIHAEASAAAHA